MKFAPLPRDLGVKNDLKEQIAELFFQLRRAGGVKSIKNFLGLLDEHRLEAFPSLLPIPGAALRPPQSLDQIDQLLNVRSLLHPANIPLR